MKTMPSEARSNMCASVAYWRPLAGANVTPASRISSSRDHSRSGTRPWPSSSVPSMSATTRRVLAGTNEVWDDAGTGSCFRWSGSSRRGATAGSSLVATATPPSG